MSDNRIDLSGQWQRSVGGTAIDYVEVPGSYAPVGECVLTREFSCDWELRQAERSFLVTQGVLASAEFTLNDTLLGKAGPWSTYRFEIPAGLLRQHNVLRAFVRDMNEAFGPTPGRRFDGGLVRPLWIERRPQTFLADVIFRCHLSEDLSSAQCSVVVELDGAEKPPVAITLVEARGRVVASGTATAAKPLTFTIEWPLLWSLSMPNLHTLTASLAGDQSLTERVGFHSLDIRDHDFYLNNERILLKGVCRHEFTDASGYSPCEAEARRELAMIKHSGFNYVRLVHSPQASSVCRIAAELGLLVSEEPGTCFHDLSDPVIAAPALECLRRTIRRDRNVPSIAAWLIYNECNPNVDYARRAAAVCRELDPDCRISMADCSGKDDEIRAMVKAAEMSYYGINIYTPWPNDYCKRMEVLTDRPVVITEWGGGGLVGNARSLKDHCDCLVRHTRPDESLRIAGCSFWAWADYEEHSRPKPAAIDGWTVEGLVAPDGCVRPDLQILSTMCFEMSQPPVTHAPTVQVLLDGPSRSEKWCPLEIDIGDQAEVERVLDDLRRSRRPYDPWYTKLDARLPAMPRFGRQLVDGIAFACTDASCAAHPLLLGMGREEARVRVDKEIAAIAVLGHVALAGGYPSSSVLSIHHRDAESPGALGAEAARYELEFADGIEVVPLRHGIEILRANDICRWWTPSPRAPATRPALRSMIDKSYEVLRIDLWERRWDRPRRLKELRWRLIDKHAILATYAISVKHA